MKLVEGSRYGVYVYWIASLAPAQLTVLFDRCRAVEAEPGEATHLLKVVGASVVHSNYNTAANLENL